MTAHKILFPVINGMSDRPCSIKDHSADPVPIYGDGVRMDEIQEFGECSCARGGLCRINGEELLILALDRVNKTHKYGA